MKTIVSASLTLLLAACGGSNLSLSIRAGAPAASASSRGDLALSNNIVLSRVRIVIRDLQLETKDGSDTNDADDDQVASGPYLLDLSGASLDGGLSKVFDASFTPGTYKSIKLKIHKLTSSDSFAGNAGLEAMNTAGASIIADGTIDGAAFTYTTSVETKEEFKGSIELKAGSNLTLNVDPTGWFSGSGGRLDPREAANVPAIDDNIKKSFKAFKDDNKDGHGD